MDSLRTRLGNGSLQLGVAVTYPLEAIVERIGADWDWVWIDGQHGQHDYRSILACVRACERIGRPAIVRVAGHDYGTIGRALDTGASGVMVPMIDTVEQAREAVWAAKFPPVGQRSYGGRRPVDLAGRGYAHTANDDTLLVAQIETKEALSNVEAIAEVPGIDVLFFSPDDMAMQDSLPMDTPREPGFFDSQLRQVQTAASVAGKYCGTPTMSPELVRLATKIGYTLCAGAGDANLLAEASRERRRLAEGAL